jgi:hypothetical protein
VINLEATSITHSWWNMVTMVILTIYRTTLNLGYMGPKTRSPGQISDKSLYQSRDQIYASLDKTWSECFILTISVPNLCLGNICLETRSPRQILKKKTWGATFVTQALWNLVRMFILTKSRASLNLGQVGSEIRSPAEFKSSIISVLN